jgi:hypothetical protein
MVVTNGSAKGSEVRGVHLILHLKRKSERMDSWQRKVEQGQDSSQRGLERQEFFEEARKAADLVILEHCVLVR